MRLSLANQPEIEQLSMPLKQSLVALKSAIQTGWNKQHNGDGEHTNITATGLNMTAGETLLGRVRLNFVTYDNILGGATQNDLSVAGLDQVSMLRIIPRANPMVITGIDAAGRTQGSLLLVVNADDTTSLPADIDLAMNSAASLAPNRFADSPMSPSFAGNVRIQGAKAVWLIYDVQRTGPASSPNLRWRVCDPTV